MYSPVVHYNPDDFIITPSGVKVSRKADIRSPQFVEMPGGKSIIMHGAVIHGDLCNITINRYCFIDEETVIRPAFMPTPIESKTNSNTIRSQDVANPDVTYVPMHVGKYTHIGKGCVIQAASIGLGCHVGDNCVISNRAILKDHVRVLKDSVVTADFVAPPFAILAGNPARIVGEVSESHPTSAQFDAKSIFKMFKSSKQ